MVPDARSGTWERSEGTVTGPGRTGGERGAADGRGAGSERGVTADAERVVSLDEESIGWGDERTDPSDEDDVARLLADRPPHHDRA
jgi:hypothetical protein